MNVRPSDYDRFVRTSRVSLLLALILSLVAACGGGGGSGAGESADPGTVKVLYAGSLVDLMEQDLGPAFEKATGGQFQGYAGGSTKLANELTGHVRRGDVFISAAPAVNAQVKAPWYATFATAPLLIGYNPHSRYARDLRTKPWPQVVAEPGIRVGRTDPALDPKGKLTVQAFEQVGASFAAKAEKSVQILPEEDLVGRLQAGQLDAAFFYSSEATETGIPTVPLGHDDLGATYTVTVLTDAPNPGGAAAFVRFLLGTHGRALLRRHGLKLQTPRISGDASTVPKSLRTILAK